MNLWHDEGYYNGLELQSEVVLCIHWHLHLGNMTSLLSVLTGETESRAGLTAVMASQEFELFLPKAKMPSRAPSDLSYSTLETSAQGASTGQVSLSSWPPAHCRTNGVCSLIRLGVVSMTKGDSAGLFCWIMFSVIDLLPSQWFF